MEEDDLDFYDQDMKQGQTRLAYDAQDRDDDNAILIGGKPNRTRGGSPPVSTHSDTGGLPL